LADKLGYQLLSDEDLIARATKDGGLLPDKLRRVLEGKSSVFNKFTHDRQRAVASIKLAIAEALAKDGLVFQGHAGHLTPPSIGHILKICLIAEMGYRVARAVDAEGLTEAQARRKLRRDDENGREWAEFVLHREPWNPTLYDIVLPMDKTAVDEAVTLIADNSRKSVVQPTDGSGAAVRDFALAARVEVALVAEGHDVDIAARSGAVTLTIDNHVIMLSRLEEELRRIASAVPGVRSVETKVGPHFYQTDIYRRHDFEVPSKVLLVDDEREFAQTLSERLLMRDVGSAIAYDGEEALSFVDEDEPDVMVLDLKMPGIDGIEVLRRVKESHPQVEVIILTGHGSSEDERTCMELGAFAYLKKPVDIDELSDAMKAAYDKVRAARRERGEG
jgi:CheY-like chemotaxis protein/cytidylate kinase